MLSGPAWAGSVALFDPQWWQLQHGLCAAWQAQQPGLFLLGHVALFAVLSFLIARHCTPTRWRQMLQARWGAPMQRFDGLMRSQGGLWLVALRLLPVVPFPALNPLLGLSSMPLRSFFWPSLVGLTLGSLPYVWAGLSLMDAWRTGQAAWGAAAAATLLLLAALAGWRLRR